MVGGACTNASMELMEVLARSRGLGELLGVDDGFNDCALGGADMVRGRCLPCRAVLFAFCRFLEARGQATYDGLKT